MDIFSILKKAINLDASDVHLIEGTYAKARIVNKFVNLTENILSGLDIKNMVVELIGYDKLERIQEKGQIDISYCLQTGERFKINIIIYREDIILYQLD